MPYADAITRPQAAPLQREKVNASLLGKPANRPAASQSAGVKPTHDFNARMRARVAARRMK